MDLWKECDAKENLFIEHLESCDTCKGPQSPWEDLCPRGKSLLEGMTRAQEKCIAALPGPRVRLWQKQVA